MTGRPISAALLLLSLVFMLTVRADAADSTRVKPKTTIWKDIVNDAKIFVVDGVDFYTYPFHMTPKEWAYTSIILGGIGLSFALDGEVKKLVGRNTSDTYNNDFWDGPSAYGFVQYPAVFAGLMYTTGLLVRSNAIRVTGRLLLESLTYSGIITMGLRYVTGRYRPYYTDDPYHFTGIQPDNDTQSFPSGHTVVAFATSTVFAEQIGTWWSRVIFYSFASLTAYARVLNNQHWLSDVVVGGLLGFGSGYFVVHRERQRNEKITKGTKGGKFSFYPTVNGIRMEYRF